MAPRTCVTLSMIEDADLDEKRIIPITPPIAAPIFTSTPKITLSPSPAPPTLPMLNAKPPRATKKAITYPRPGSTLFAMS